MKRIEVLFLAVGLALLGGGGIWYWVGVHRPGTWPQAAAEVVSSRVINPDGPGQYKPEVGFRYSVNGSSREQLIVPSWSTASYDMVRSHIDRYPPGSRVMVAVNPTDPADIRYEIGATLTNLLGPGILALLGLVFGGIGVVAMRPLRPRPANMPAEAKRDPLHRVGPIFGLIGVVLLAIGGVMAWGDFRMLRDWPQVDGEVTAVEVVNCGGSTSGRGSGGAPMYDTRVTFRYQVDGRPYENGTMFGISSSNRDGANQRAARYAVGTRHPIRHRPGDPNVVRYDMDGGISTFLLSGGMLLMGMVFCGFGYAIPKFLLQGPK